jgi:hypothetical protein
MKTLMILITAWLNIQRGLIYSIFSPIMRGIVNSEAG